MLSLGCERLEYSSGIMSTKQATPRLFVRSLFVRMKVSDNLVLFPDAAADEDALVDDLKAGREEAFLLLYRRYVGRVHRLATLMLNESSAEDVVQEVFLRIFRSVGRFRGDAALGTWIHRIAANVCLSTLDKRQRERRRRGALLAEGTIPELVDLSVAEARHDLAPLLRRLTATQRTTFVLHHVAGFTAREVAEIVGDSRDAVLKRLQRTRAELASQLTGHEKKGVTRAAGDEANTLGKVENNGA